MKRQLTGIIVKNEALQPGLYEMGLSLAEFPQTILPGQFVNLYSPQSHLLLPRPISICEVKREKKELRLLYAVVGKGTQAFSALVPGQSLRLMGPLGNGFTIRETDRHHLVVGGGIGVPPLLELVKGLKGQVTVVLGFRGDSMLTEEFEQLGAQVKVASEQGITGIRGTVMDLLKDMPLTGKEMIYSCGPKGMLKAVARWAAEKNLPAQLSFEERMACGIGACLVCTCKTQKPQETDWQYRRVCKDGPVFWREEVVWE